MGSAFSRNSEHWAKRQKTKDDRFHAKESNASIKDTLLKLAYNHSRLEGALKMITFTERLSLKEQLEFLKNIQPLQQTILNDCGMTIYSIDRCAEKGMTKEAGLELLASD
jgi:hypothetical protein